MQMDVGLDTGPVLLARRVPIGPEDTAGTLEAKLALLGAEAIVEALAGLEAGRLTARPQPDSGVTYAQKLSREEARLDWSRTASEIERAIRAYNPAPGAYTTIDGQVLKIWGARVEAGGVPSRAPGEVLDRQDDTLAIACGTDILCVAELQRASGRRQTAAEFLRGHPLSPGTRLGT